MRKLLCFYNAGDEERKNTKRVSVIFGDLKLYYLLPHKCDLCGKVVTTSQKLFGLPDCTYYHSGFDEVVPFAYCYSCARKQAKNPKVVVMGGAYTANK